jgi:hypothetical protein
MHPNDVFQERGVLFGGVVAVRAVERRLFPALVANVALEASFILVDFAAADAGVARA